MNAAKRKGGGGESGWAVLKFGGTSVASATNWATIRDLLRERLDAGMRPLVVHSAIAGTSEQLEELLRQGAGGAHEALLAEIVGRYTALAAELGIDGEALLQLYASELEELIGAVRRSRKYLQHFHYSML